MYHVIWLHLISKTFRKIIFENFDANKPIHAFYLHMDIFEQIDSLFSQVLTNANKTQQTRTTLVDPTGFYESYVQVKFSDLDIDGLHGLYLACYSIQKYLCQSLFSKVRLKTADSQYLATNSTYHKLRAR
jgi:hypothetical protein